MENEIWKPVIGYEGLYEVSNLGRIRSLAKKRGNVLLPPRIIKGKINSHGYYQHILVKEGQRKTISRHRIVAQAFIPNPDNKTDIDHINTIRTDNRVENLRWATKKENSNNPLTLAKQRAKTGPLAGKYGILHPHSVAIRQYSKDMTLIKEYPCIQDAIRQTGINNLSAVAKGKRHSAGGYIWKYVKDSIFAIE